MKKITTVSIKMLALVIIMQLASCKKFIEKYCPDPDPETLCRITKVVQDESFAMRTGYFYYNQHGDPDSVIFDEGLGAARTYYFRYNAQHQLTNYDAFYNDNEPENYYYKHVYTYDNGRIVADTARIREAGEYTQVSNFDYDSQGRIVKESRTVVESEGSPSSEVLDPFIFTYNAAGNLELSGGSAYDNKVNYLRTNGVWMFIQRNYSQNNAIAATGYNGQDLPLGFTPPQPQGNFLQFSDPATIEYLCDEAPKGHRDSVKN